MRFLIPLFVCLSLNCFGQVEYTLKNDIVTFQKVIDIPGASADSLYDLTNNWVKTYYKDRKITIISKRNGQSLKSIKGRGEEKTKMMLGKKDYRYDIQLDIEKEKVTVTLDDFLLQGFTTENNHAGSGEIERFLYKPDKKTERNTPHGRDIKEGVTSNANALFNSLEAHLKGGTQE